MPSIDAKLNLGSYAVLTLILVGYLCLAFYRLDGQSLWEDEYLSIARVMSPMPIWKDGHGFLYFALLRGWMWLGDSTVMLRAMSGLLGALAICLFYQLSLSMCGRRTAMIGAILLATSPFFIWYSQEIRYMTLTITTALLAMLTLQQALAKNHFIRWLVYGIALLASLLTFIGNLFLICTQALYLITQPERYHMLRQWAVCQLIVLGCFGWWIVNGTHYMQAVTVGQENGLIQLDAESMPTGAFNRVNAAVIPYTLFALSTGFSLGPSPAELQTRGALTSLGSEAPLLGGLALLFGSLASLGMLAVWRLPGRGELLTLWIGIPIAGAFAVSALFDWYYNVRYVCMVLPAYTLVLAAGITRFRRVQVQMILLVMVLGIHTVALANYYVNPRYAREDARSAARYLEAEVHANDAILSVGTLSALPFYYQHTIPVTPLREILPSRRVATAQAVKVFSRLYERVWLVEIRSWQDDPAGEAKAALDRLYPVIAERHFPGVNIYAYRVAK